MVIGTRRARFRPKKIHAENVPKSMKIAVSSLNPKFSQNAKTFTIKNNFFTRFSFSKLVSSSKSKKVTAKTKISEKRRNTNFAPL